MSVDKRGAYLRDIEGNAAFRHLIQPRIDIKDTSFTAEGNRNFGHWRKSRVSRNPPAQMNGQKPPKTDMEGIKRASSAPYVGGKKPSLVIRFEVTMDAEKKHPLPKMYHARLGKNIHIRITKHFIKKSRKVKWIGVVQFRQKTLFRYMGKDHKSVMAHLCGERWFFYQERGEWWSLYDVYKTLCWIGLDIRQNRIPDVYVDTLDARHIRGVWFFMKDQERPKIKWVVPINVSPEGKEPEEMRKYEYSLQVQSFHQTPERLTPPRKYVGGKWVVKAPEHPKEVSDKIGGVAFTVGAIRGMTEYPDTAADGAIKRLMNGDNPI